MLYQIAASAPTWSLITIQPPNVLKINEIPYHPSHQKTRGPIQYYPLLQSQTVLVPQQALLPLMLYSTVLSSRKDGIYFENRGIPILYLYFYCF